jgi:glycosyltransferase involved in cell wall biosynthesis
MKVLHISGSNGWGGNEQQMIYLFPELKKLGVENIVLGVKDSVLLIKCKKLNIPFFEAKSYKLNKIVNYRFIKEIVNKVNPDLIHLHTSDSLTVFTISDIVFKLKTKAVFSKKGMGASSSFLSKFKYNYKGVDSIICVSNSVKRDLGEILKEKNKIKTVVIHDCISLEIKNITPKINLRERFKIDDKTIIIGNIANHTSAKDLPTFIDVLEEVVNKLEFITIKFVQIGKFSKNTPIYKELIKEKGLEDYVFFTDQIENASSLMPQFDIFLMTSQREGGPTSVLESMLLGTPVIATNVGVIPDVIKDGVNGFIAPIKDYKLLAEKMLILSKDESLKLKFSKKSKLVIEQNFTAQDLAKQTKEEYERIIKNK